MQSGFLFIAFLSFSLEREGKEGAAACGLDRCKLPRGQGEGRAGLSWLQKHLLPWEHDEKQEKNTEEG